MKKILSILILIGILVLPVTALAGELDDIVWGIADAIELIFFGLVVVMFIYAGIMFLTAAGNPEKLAKAKQAIFWGVIGTIVGILAWSVERIVQDVML